MRTKLIGFYGKYSLAALGTEVVAAATLDAGVLYVATGVDASTSLPTGIEVGYAFYADGTETLTGDDKAKPLTFADKCDIQSWSLDFSKSEVDVTTLCDDQNKYLGGRTDVTGSVEGIYTIGTTDTAGGIANGFFDIVRQAADGGAITIDKIEDSEIVAVLYKQKDKSAGETEQFYLAPATITSFSDSVSGSDAQSFSSSFRISPNAEINFQLVSVTR